MKRWLALQRWRLLLATIVVVCLRIILGFAFASDVGEQLGAPARLTVTTVLDVAMCAGIVATIVAFVQYGRIFNARIPTE